MIGRRTAPPPDGVVAESMGPKSFDDYEVRLGDVMRGERATLGKSLLDVQRELKIKASYIAAIENADPSAFETPGFVAGYVRSYARYLQLDPEWAYGQFCDEGNFQVSHGLSSAARNRQEKPKRPDGAARATVSRDPFEDPNTPFAPRGESVFARIEPGALGSLTVLAALIAGLTYGGWAVLQQVQKVQLTPVDQTPGVAMEVDRLAPSEAIGTESAGLAPPPADAFDRLYRPQALDVPVLTARDGPIATLDPSSIGTFASPAESSNSIAQTEAEPPANAEPDPRMLADASPVKVVEDAAPKVVMFAVRPSWVRVTSQDGTVLFEQILDSGEPYVLPQTEEAPKLRAGNAGAVYFLVGGQTYGPAGEGGAVVKNVPLGHEDLRGNYAVADLTQDRELAKIVASLEALPTEE
ncbi:RodZ domain-containing protein [Pseudoruegeria sp. HB172150]|uniref:helix-turn-helix domain-containing protein n=1 Tax=Pseudoruegeria sp. HB172150 TaxID=2721164 RepID=UPI00155222D1|nr:RodZ domain-containing protein [Pseudoruegeria sp. HB172150]